MHLFAECLVSPEPFKNRDISLFGQFVGEWDFNWVGHGSNEGRIVKGEWIFNYILQGAAIKDVFICPSREERKIKPEKDGEYGTTLRIPMLDEENSWDITYGCEKGGPVSHLIAKKEGKDIIQRGVSENSHETVLWEWNFTEIKEDSFHWICRHSDILGESWKVDADIFAKRRK